MPIIDFHTHAFPDTIAPKAIPALESEANWKAVLNGTIASLLHSMDQHGLEKSVVASIATKPAQFDPILNWCTQIASPRLIPLASVHPDDPQWKQRILAVKDAGIRGLKIHPYYQDFVLDDEKLFPYYKLVQDLGLILLSHTGFDVAYPRERKCDPIRVANVINQFPQLKLVTSHLGGWQDWDEVEAHILGRPIYMDISFSIDWVGPERARDFMLRHPSEYILFGTDSPWADQGLAIQALKNLNLGQDRTNKILGQNAEKLINSIAI